MMSIKTMTTDEWSARRDKLDATLRAAPTITLIGSHWDNDLAACLIGAEKICKHYGKQVDIRSNVEPKREQDKMVAKLFRLNRFLPIEENATYPFTFLVDAPSFNSKLYKVKLATKPNIIIDHHDLTDEEQKEVPQEDENSWYWHDSFGACASMIGKLLLDLNIPLKTPIDDVATLALIGIFSDTANLTSLFTRNLDREIIAELGKYADQETINLVSSSTLSPEFLRVLHIATAEENCEFGRKSMVVCLGEKPRGQHEFIESHMPRIADMFLKTTGITIVYVWAIDGDNNQLVIKARNSDMTRPGGDTWLNRHLLEVFGKGNAGAKHGAEGGANVDLGPAGLTPNREALINVWRDYLNQKLLD